MFHHEHHHPSHAHHAQHGHHHPQYGHHHPHAHHPYHSQATAHKPSLEEMRRRCHDHLHRYVLVHTDDGRAYDGIIAEVDRQHVYLAVPIGADETGTAHDQVGDTGPMHKPVFPGQHRSQPEAGREEDARQFPYGVPYGFGHPYGGFGPGYFRPRPRFRRIILPLAALTALSVLPYWY